jgi:hypothetical protein
MDRRTFLLAGAGAGAAVGVGAAVGAGAAVGPAVKAGEQARATPSPASAPALAPRNAAVFAYGYDRLYDADEPYVLRPGPHLFVDWRYVQAGGLAWQTPDGKPIHYFPKAEPRGVSAHAVQVPRGIRLINQKAQSLGPVVPNDREWEYCIYSYISLFDLGGKFGMWYEVVPPGDDSHHDLLCYAESTDGVNWTKPELNLVEFRGSRKNNIVLDGSQQPHYKTMHGTNVWLDPSAPAEQRFRLAFMAFPPDAALEKFQAERPWACSQFGKRKHSVIQFASSPDGFHWTFDDRIAMQHMSDTQTICYHDPILKRYVGYFRTQVMARRSIGRAETEDLSRWPLPETVLWSHGDDDPTDDYYNSSRVMYPGTQDLHLMFPTIYHRRDETCTLRMASSLEGIFWRWTPGGAVLSPGAPGEWNGECVFGGCGLVEIPGDRVALPFAGYQYAHKYPRWPRAGQVGLAVWKKHRLCALEAAEAGEFWMVPSLLPGQRLYVNFQTHQAGFIRVGVEGVDGRGVADCDPLSGDQLDAPVTWGGESSLRVAEGKPATLHVSLRSAKLFSFEIR